MATDRDIEEFIEDSFTSIWDLELLGALLDRLGQPLVASELVARMRASELVVERSIHALLAAGLVLVDETGGVSFHPVDENAELRAREARDFYRRFPGRVRRLIVARHAPGLSAFADAFRLRKD